LSVIKIFLIFDYGFYFVEIFSCPFLWQSNLSFEAMNNPLKLAVAHVMNQHWLEYRQS